MVDSPKQRGRPKMPADKRKVYQGIRFSQHVVDRFKASGKGWQTRIHEVLVEYLEANPEFGRGGDAES